MERRAKMKKENRNLKQSVDYLILDCTSSIHDTVHAANSPEPAAPAGIGTSQCMVPCWDLVRTNPLRWAHMPGSVQPYKEAAGRLCNLNFGSFSRVFLPCSLLTHLAVVLHSGLRIRRAPSPTQRPTLLFLLCTTLCSPLFFFIRSLTLLQLTRTLAVPSLFTCLTFQMCAVLILLG
ncbi:hypothetical protein F5Y03DRAFT_257752 [Xylaria venustula]|nr:hypothetical protein F5Y03DRAFT_257752 [Xylaria venustula]